jgi:hypothetical protein
MTISEQTVIDQPVLLPSNKVISDISIDISGCDNDTDKDAKKTQRCTDKWDEKEGIYMYTYTFSDVHMYVYVNIYIYIYLYMYIGESKVDHRDSSDSTERVIEGSTSSGSISYPTLNPYP